MISQHRAKGRGTSLVEVVVSTMLVGLMLVAALNAVGAVVKTSRRTSADLVDRSLAHSLMAEILAASYIDPDDPSPEFGIEASEPQSPSNRSAFDDSDDYIFWTESPPAAKDGTALPNSTGWTRSVEIKKIEDDDPLNVKDDGQGDKGVRRITVTVTSPGGDVTMLRAIRAEPGANEQAVGVDTTLVTGMTIELDAGGAPPVFDGINLINHATGP